MDKLPPPPFFILRGHEGYVSALRFCNEKDHALQGQPTLLSGSDNGEIFIWNLQSFRTLYRLYYSEKKTIMFLEYYKSKLICQSQDGVINIWTYDCGKWNITTKFISSTVGFCASVFWLLEGEAYTSLCNQEKHQLDLYNVDENKLVKTLNFDSSDGLCMCLKVIEVKKKWILIMGFESGVISLIDIESNSKLHSLNFHKESVMSLDFDYQKKMRGISGSCDEFLEVWRINDNYELESVYQLELNTPGVSNIKIREDGKIVITAGWDFCIRIFSWNSFKLLATLLFHNQSVLSLACSLIPVDKKNSVFASGSKDKNIALWNIY